MKFKVILPPKGTLDARRYRKAIDLAINQTGMIAFQELRAATRKWRHKPDFQFRREAEDTISVSTEDLIFLYQDEGTKPHVIRPKRKRALFWPGARHPVRRVHHPGTKAMGYSAKAQAAAERAAPRIFDRELEKAGQ